ncbi:MAG TPA: zinc ribbon domain-containing protein [Candidatus Deferrimicrobium sp.]|nr:zinc ribbon domain-containing protein [Candidatus Deferrimicrobium sp.]
MSYTNKLVCKRKKCQGQMTVPLKVIVKGDKVVDIARCPKCHESYKFILPLRDKDVWMEMLGEPFFECDVCGTANPKNWQVMGGDYAMRHAERLKILMTCGKCRKRRAKVVSRALWNELAGFAKVEQPAEIPSPEMKCPHCNASITEDTKFCPTCKKEIICNKCGAPIIGGSLFCGSCGDKVETLAPTGAISAEDRENICPSCNEDVPKGSVFCGVCGQELVCNKCGAKIREGAKFCANCGDPVRAGDLSE